jgi:hypothetical protein
VPVEPSDAISAGHAHFDQREALDLPGFEAGLGADDLVARNANPLLDHRIGRRPLAGEADKLGDFSADGDDLELGCALPTEHTD